ncbi:hypothetical protein E4U55_006830 [Claviceps digitariae]|nr:hypothetical protein E4U55_006830 [Claviceps digitariae]
MVFCKEENREFLQSLKTLIQRDREAGEYVPPNFDSILQSLDEMTAKNDGTFWKPSDGDVDGDMDVDVDADASTTYSPGRKEYEILQAYNSLIEAGGRPVCPLGDTYHVSKDPERYLEILVPWIGGGSASTADRGLDWKDIFQQQLLNWQQFRAWQRSHRDGHQTHHIKPMSSPSPDSSSSSTRGDGPRSSKLDMHVESTRERLTHCGFTKSFSFHNDAASQDDWTTWIEYLSFECFCLDDCSRRLTAAAADESGDLRIAMAVNHPASTAVGSSGNSLSKVRSSALEESKATSAPITSSNQPCGDAPRPPGIRRTDCCSNDESLAVTTSWIDDSPVSESTSTFTSTSTSTPPSASTFTSQTYHERTTDSTPNKRSKPTQLHDAEQHSRILKWAFLQEPKIAATCSRQPALTSPTHHEPDPEPQPAKTSGLQGFKRRRDGSIRGPPTTLMSHANSQEDIPTDDPAELEAKRCRSSAQ